MIDPKQTDGGWTHPRPHEPAVFDSYSEPKPGQGDPVFLSLLNEIRELHLLKSGGYGTGADPFANFTGIAALTGRARYEYPIERMIEKMTRCLSLLSQGRIDELGEEFGDIAGLALCAEAMRRSDA